MARADRLERIDTRRAELEAEYHEALVAALRVTAGGAWGLFDHRRDRHERAKVAPVIDLLAELADAIGAMRDQLGLAPFDLHRRFLAARGPVASNEVGEPRQAQAWLRQFEPDEAGHSPAE